MQLRRPIVTIIASLALLQLVLVGSGVPCVTPMAHAGQHDARARAHADPVSHATATSQAHDAVPDGGRSTDCGLRACTVSPAIPHRTLAAVVTPPTPAGLYPPAAASPSSPARFLDPPPPRA
jgi:hypothetical protein